MFESFSFRSKITLFALILILSFFQGVSFASGYDSLMQVIKNLPDEDKIDPLINACWEKHSSDPVLALKFGKSALQIIDRIENKEKKSTVLSYIGVIYSNLGNLDSAYIFYQHAYELAKNSTDRNELGYCLNNLGDYYTKNALYSTAVEKLLQAYTIFNEIKSTRGMAYSLNDIGEVYLLKKDYYRALNYFQRSGKLRYQDNDLRGYARSLTNIASAQEKLDQLQQAIETYTEAISISEKVQYIRGISYCYAGLSEIYNKQGRTEKALEYRYKALEIDKNISNKYGMILCYNALGGMYTKMGKLTEADKYLKLAETVARTSGHLDQLVVAYNNLTALFVAKNDIPSAFAYQQKYDALKEQIFSQESEGKIADLQTAFITEQKDRENAMLKKDIEYQRTTTNYLIIIFVLVLVSFIIMYRLQKKSTLLLKQLNTSKDKFFSIIAHDLKNPIGAVYNYADILSTDYDQLDDVERRNFVAKILSSSQQIRDLLLDLLTWARSQKGEIRINKTQVDLKETIKSIIESYAIAAESKKIRIHVSQPATCIVNADKSVLQTIIGNLLNNAIKFSNNESEIAVSVKEEKNSIAVTVSDTGVGMSPEVLANLFNVDVKHTSLGTNKERGTGMGLKICKEFAELHGGSLHVESTLQKGSTFTFTFANM